MITPREAAIKHRIVRRSEMIRGLYVRITGLQKLQDEDRAMLAQEVI